MFILHKATEGKKTSSKGTVGDSNWYETVASWNSEMEKHVLLIS